MSFVILMTCVKKYHFKFPCSVCKKPYSTNQQSILCDICSKWIHLKFTNLNLDTFDKPMSPNEDYFLHIFLFLVGEDLYMFKPPQKAESKNSQKHVNPNEP